ncbi:T-cell surface glycoprotein CD4 [Carettochelys insculpta]|uniref:T-cell surface glycoprotein CD4 n=1 Tax=Carettochelys insculpta TaxID=44489 RepID=UPI003EC09891
MLNLAGGKVTQPYRQILCQWKADGGSEGPFPQTVFPAPRGKKQSKRMGPSLVVANSVLAVFSVTQLGLVPVMAEGEIVFGVVGGQVILPCNDKPQGNEVTWKYNNHFVIWHRETIFRGTIQMASRSDLNKQEIPKGNFSLKLSQLELSDAGKYICTVGARTVPVELQVFEVTGSPAGYLLQNERLILTIKAVSNVNVKWFDNRNQEVTSTVSRQLKEGGQSLEIKNLQPQDSGTWRCHVASHSANLDIPYKVLVTGFHTLGQEWIYTAVNSIANFTYSLSIHLQQTRGVEYFRGSLAWKKEEKSNYTEILNFNVTDDRLFFQKDKIQVTMTSRSELQVKLTKVGFQDAGVYQCKLTSSRSSVEKNIALVVMNVSADPAGPLPTGADVTLFCKLSAALVPQKAQLFLEHMNGTEPKFKKTGSKEVTVKTKDVGLWRCSLKVQDTVLTSIDYTVVKAAEWSTYVLIWVGSGVGAGIVLLLLASLCTFICTARQRRRRRAEKMARARRDLIERRTCQCQRQMKVGYSSA